MPKMVLLGFIDESYSDKVFTLSCLMSDSSQWMWFESAWKKCLKAKNNSLRKAGRPLISRYHAADCSSRRNEFKGWSTQEQIDLTKQLLAVFKRTRIMDVIGYSIPMKEFRTEFPDAKDPIATCYKFLLRYLMLEMVDQIQTAKSEYPTKSIQIKLFHDRSSYDTILSESFAHMMNDPTFAGKEYFSTLTAISWEDRVALQAADLLAYENFKEVERTITGRNRRKTLELLLDLDSVGGRARRFEASTLKMLRER